MTDDDSRTRLGRAIGVRMRRPGPVLGRRRPSPIGSVASSSVRFSAGWGRSVSVRRALAGPAATISVGSGPADVQPPRWWSQVSGARSTAAPPDVSTRGLPRMLDRVPDQSSYRPGTGTSRLAPSTVAPLAGHQA